MLIQCTECGKEISDMAEKCPNCGCPINANKSFDTNVYQNTVYVRPYESKKKVSVLSILALVFSVLGVTFFIGVILAIIDLCKRDDRKKICSIIALVICGIWLVIGIAGLANDGEDSKETSVVKEETLEEFIIDGFEKAEYEKYNSYASENGLAGDLIYVEGTVINQTIIADSDIDALSVVIEQEDGNRWCIGVPVESKIEEIEGKNVRIFGTYQGFSDAVNLPAIIVASEDAKIQVKENGEYKTVWSFMDYVKEEMTSQKDSDIEEISKTEKEVAIEETIDEETEDVEENDDSKEYVPTMGEKNALRKADSYLSLMPFSYDGLVEQLEYEGYSKEESIYAADNCGADWNEQATKKAKDYLELMPFSKEGLIEQLEYDGFTHEQSVYGAEQNGY